MTDPLAIGSRILDLKSQRDRLLKKARLVCDAVTENEFDDAIRGLHGIVAAIRAEIDDAN